MLHRFKSLRGDISRPLFFLSVAVVALAAVGAAGLRGSAAANDPAPHAMVLRAQTPISRPIRRRSFRRKNRE